MLDRDLSLAFSHFRLVPEARPCVQHSMRRNLPVSCLKLQRNGFGFTRIIRQVPFSAHSCCIRGYDQAMFATEDIGFLIRMRKGDVRKAREKRYVSKEQPHKSVSDSNSRRDTVFDFHIRLDWVAADLTALQAHYVLRH